MVEAKSQSNILKRNKGAYRANIFHVYSNAYFQSIASFANYIENENSGQFYSQSDNNLAGQMFCLTLRMWSKACIYYFKGNLKSHVLSF